MASAVATPLERQFTTIAGLDSMTSTSVLGLDADHAPVQPRAATSTPPPRTCRRPSRAAAAPAAARHAGAAVLPEGQPGRPADPLPRAHLADAPALDRRRVRRDDHGAADLDGRAASRRSRSSARRSTPSASSSTRGRSPRGASASTRSPTPSAAANVNLPTGTLWGRDTALHGRGDRPARRRRPATARSSSPTATARRCALEDVGDVLDSVENDKTAAWFDGRSGPSSSRSRSSPARTRSRSSTQVKKLLPSFRGAAPGLREARRPLRPLGVDPRVGRRREVHAPA